MISWTPEWLIIVFGYLLAFMAAPWVVTHCHGPAMGIAVGSALILVTGTIWLKLWLGCQLLDAAALGLLPFLPGDVLKAIVAYRLVRRVAIAQEGGPRSH